MHTLTGNALVDMVIGLALVITGFLLGRIK